MSPESGAPRRTFLKLLVLLGLFATASLLFSYAAWPILLWPYLEVLARSPLAGLLGLLPCLLVRLDSAEGAEQRPWLLRYFSLTGLLDGVLLGGLLGALLILGQIILIRAKPFLTLDLYLREEVWVLWIAMMILGIGYGLLLYGWSKMIAVGPWSGEEPS